MSTPDSEFSSLHSHREGLDPVACSAFEMAREPITVNGSSSEHQLETSLTYMQIGGKSDNDTLPFQFPSPEAAVTPRVLVHEENANRETLLGKSIKFRRCKIIKYWEVMGWVWADGKQ